MPVDMTQLVNLKAFDTLASVVSAKFDEISTDTGVTTVSGGLGCYLGSSPPENFNGLIFNTKNFE